MSHPDPLFDPENVYEEDNTDEAKERAEEDAEQARVEHQDNLLDEEPDDEQLL